MMSMADPIVIDIEIIKIESFLTSFPYKSDVQAQINLFICSLSLSMNVFLDILNQSSPSIIISLNLAM